MSFSFLKCIQPALNNVIFRVEYLLMEAPYAMVWLHSCGSSLFTSQEKFSFICSCRWAQMPSDAAKWKKGNVYFPNQRIIQIQWTAKHKSSKAEGVLGAPIKARAPERTSSFENVGTSLADAALMVPMVHQINSVHSAWRPDICWMTGCYALLLFLLGSSSFILFHCTVKDMDFNHDSCLLKCVLVLLVIL